MTRFVFAIRMRRALFAALKTAADDFIRNLLAETIVENEIYAFEFIFQPLISDLTHVFDNSAFEMKNFFKAFVEQIGARLFAADSARAVHYYGLIFFVFEHFSRHRQLLAESV